MIAHKAQLRKRIYEGDLKIRSLKEVYDEKSTLGWQEKDLDKSPNFVSFKWTANLVFVCIWYYGISFPGHDIISKLYKFDRNEGIKESEQRSKINSSRQWEKLQLQDFNIEEVNGFFKFRSFHILAYSDL